MRFTDEELEKLAETLSVEEYDQLIDYGYCVDTLAPDISQRTADKLVTLKNRMKELNDIADSGALKTMSEVELTEYRVIRRRTRVNIRYIEDTDYREKVKAYSRSYETKIGYDPVKRHEYYVRNKDQQQEAALAWNRRCRANPNPESINYHCDTCGKGIHLKPSEMKANAHHFCSSACQGIYFRKRKDDSNVLSSHC